MILSEVEMLAAKRLRDTRGLGFAESFALLQSPEVDVAALAAEEQRQMVATREALFPKPSAPPVESE
jgi:hypothetical protein